MPGADSLAGGMQHLFFVVYVAALLISGIGMILVTLVPGQSRNALLFQGLGGLAVVVYGGYLQFVFQGGHFLIIWPIFFVPVALIVGTVKTLGDRRKAAKAAKAAAH